MKIVIKNGSRRTVARTFFKYTFYDKVLSESFIWAPHKQHTEQRSQGDAVNVTTTAAAAAVIAIVVSFVTSTQIQTF